MRTAAAILAALLAIAAIFVATIYLASESGEVVTLTTYDGAGAPHASRLWVVDDAGRQWLRAGLRTNSWYGRLVARPDVEVRRGNETRAYQAVPVDTPAARDRIHELMAAKYGLADRYIGLVRDGTGSVAVRLDPREN